MMGPGGLDQGLGARLAGHAKAPGPRIDIAEAALVLGELGRPGVDPAPYRAHLAALAEAARRTATLEGVAAHLFDRLGYRGDTETYEDLRNANLTHVIDRRQGLPVALGVLALHAWRAAGLEAWGANAPGHFLVMVETEDGPELRDPFNGGRVVSEADLAQLFQAAGWDAASGRGTLSPMDDRAVLARLQNNIKIRALAAEDLERAAQALGTMVILAPRDAAFWRELALVETRRENLRAAAGALEGALAATTDAGSARGIELELRALRARLN
jgi:regulator of sirC expression with transglutaminase-like and TPR domain